MKRRSFFACSRALVLCLLSHSADAAVVRWFIHYDSGDTHDVLARVYGDDTNGLAGFTLMFQPSFEEGLDLANALWVSPFETLDATFSPEEITIETRIDSGGLGLEESLNVGQLTVPGSSASLPDGTGWSKMMAVDILPISQLSSYTRIFLLGFTKNSRTMLSALIYGTITGLTTKDTS